MSEISELYEALSEGFNDTIKVHPNLNMRERGKTNELNEPVPITKADILADTDVLELVDPIVPRTSNITESIAISIAGGTNTPRQWAWYSLKEFKLGTIVEYKNHIYQINDNADNAKFAGIFVYYLKGDDSIEPV